MAEEFAFRTILGIVGGVAPVASELLDGFPAPGFAPLVDGEFGAVW